MTVSLEGGGDGLADDIGVVTVTFVTVAATDDADVVVTTGGDDCGEILHANSLILANISMIKIKSQKNQWTALAKNNLRDTTQKKN